MPEKHEPNKPLKFRLDKLEREHPYLVERGLAPETVAHFEIGFCTKGMMAERIAIPIRNPDGALVAYVGRFPGEAPGDTPKYKLPPGFRKAAELFNIERAMKEPADMWPLYLSLYNGNGSFWSWNYFDTNGIVSSNQVPIAGASPSWIKITNSARIALHKEGFTNTDAVMVGSYYSLEDRPLLTNLDGDSVIIEGGNLTNVLTNTLATTGKLETTNILLTFTKTTGKVSGFFLDGAKKTAVNRVLLQGQSNVAGFFLGTNQSGLFQIVP